jgi:SlyX protein
MSSSTGKPRAMNESIKRLEEKIAYLERHVTEQDKVMLQLADDLARLRKELERVRTRETPGGSNENSAADFEERPPHY